MRPHYTARARRDRLFACDLRHVSRRFWFSAATNTADLVFSALRDGAVHFAYRLLQFNLAAGIPRPNVGLKLKRNVRTTPQICNRLPQTLALGDSPPNAFGN